MPTLFWRSQFSFSEVYATIFIAFGCNIPQVPRNICLGVGAWHYTLNFFIQKANEVSIIQEFIAFMKQLII
jgi:hypothetical protein